VLELGNGVESRDRKVVGVDEDVVVVVVVVRW